MEKKKQRLTKKLLMEDSFIIDNFLLKTTFDFPRIFVNNEVIKGSIEVMNTLEKYDETCVHWSFILAQRISSLILNTLPTNNTFH